MTEIQVRPKADKRIAWQYEGSHMNEPAWVIHCTGWNNIGKFILKRQSGNQIINIGEWLIKDLDGGIIWCPDKDMWKDWEKV